MGGQNVRATRLLVSVLSLSIFLLIFGTLDGRDSGAQVHRGGDGEMEADRAAVKAAPAAGGPSTELQVELKLLRSRVETLEMQQKILRRQSRAMALEIERLEGLLGGAAGWRAGGPKRLDIDRVARTGGRPDAKDALVSMAGMLAVWQQIDAILGKLDEVTTALSGS
jgi:hypothetical protein